MNHRLNMGIPQLRRFLNAPLKRFVLVANELHIHTEKDFAHNKLFIFDAVYHP